MGLDHVRSEIEHMRVQVGRQRKEILQLQRAGLSTASAELLLEECTQRSTTFVLNVNGSRRQRRPRQGGAYLAGGAGDGRVSKWYDEKADNSPWIDALAEVRHRATREGYCYQHVQAVIVAIDQYAEAALGNRDYFLNKPYGVG